MPETPSKLEEYLESGPTSEHEGVVPPLPVKTLLEILSVLPMGIALYTPDRRMWGFNRIAAELSDLPPDLARPGMKIEEIVRAHAERGDYGEGDIDELISARMETVYDTSAPPREITLPNGNIAQYGSHLLSDGTLIIFIRDMTEQRQQEAEILVRQKHLEELNFRKDELFALIAHDLRSPLTAVVGFAEMIENLAGTEMNQEKIKDYAGNLAVGARSLAELVENLLSWARLQMEDYRFTPDKCNISDVAMAAIQPLQILAREKDVGLSLQLPAWKVLADRDMVQTVIRNLVNNSIKFVDRGGEIAVSCSGRPDGKLEIKVADNGTGMSESAVKNILSGTQTETKVGTSNETGTGLGLLICNRFLSEHNSELKIESEPGKGSAFSFALDTA